MLEAQADCAAARRGSTGGSTQPMSNEIVLAIVAVAAIVGIYLLRHIIVLTFRLLVLAALVLAAIWVWEHRGEVIDAARPYLGGIGDRLGELALPDLPGLLDLLELFSDDDPSAPEDPATPEIAGIPEESEASDVREPPERFEEADRPGDPTAPE